MDPDMHYTLDTPAQSEPHIAQATLQATFTDTSLRVARTTPHKTA